MIGRSLIRNTHIYITALFRLPTAPLSNREFPLLHFGISAFSLKISIGKNISLVKFFKTMFSDVRQTYKLPMEIK